MNIAERIARRRRQNGEIRLIRSYDALNPAAHVREPSGRESALEQLLDWFEPAFDGEAPGNCYVWGPKGTGKSALLTALFSELGRTSRDASAIHTTTRAADTAMPTFTYVDARGTRSEVGFRHAVVDSLLAERVPKQGVGRDHFTSLLEDRFRDTSRRAVVAVDHLGEPDTPPVAALDSFLASAPDSVAWIAAGRSPPADLGVEVATSVHLPAYERYVLVDILTSRTTRGLNRQAISHEELRRIAEWADGDAHDALSTLFGAAVLASEADERTIDPTLVDEGMAAVPRPSVSIGRVLSLPANRQRVLRELLDCEPTERSVTTTAEALASDRELSLSAGTITRYLYELAESGILERVRADRSDGLGRPPSRLELRFPTLVFRRLFDARDEA
ncbi:MAG: AAA family ATPase [Halalkalicoccus sp.]